MAGMVAVLVNGRDEEVAEWIKDWKFLLAFFCDETGKNRHNGLNACQSLLLFEFILIAGLNFVDLENDGFVKDFIFTEFEDLLETDSKYVYELFLKLFI